MPVAAAFELLPLSSRCRGPRAEGAQGAQPWGSGGRSHRSRGAPEARAVSLPPAGQGQGKADHVRETLK